MEKKHTRILLKLLYIALGILAGWVLLRWGLGLVLPFLLALLIAGMLEKPVVLLRERLKMPRWAASALCTLVLYGLLSVVAYFLVSRVIIEVGVLIKRLPEWISGLPSLAEDLTMRARALISTAPEGMQEFLDNSLSRIIDEGVTIPQSFYDTLVNWVKDVAGAVPNLLLFVITSVLSTYFISSDYPRIKSFLLLQIPENWRERATRTKAHMQITLGKWLRAQALLIALTFVQLCVGMFLIGIPYPLTTAAVVCLVDALPVVGLGIVLVPWAGLSLLMGQTGRALGLVILFAVCSLVRNFAEPKLVGAQIGLPPVVAMLAMYVGFKTFGVLGMLLFPLLTIMLKQMQEWGYIKLFRT